jgi:hypothetical protein
LQISFDSAIPIDILSDGFGIVASNALEVSQEFSLLEEYLLLQGSSKFIKDVADSILVVDLG